MKSLSSFEYFSLFSCVDVTLCRIDTGVEEGSQISIYYDPLIAKLITSGENRLEAIKRMESALDQFVVRGVNHNIVFLRDVMQNKRFLEVQRFRYSSYFLLL
jgi:acetyl/propionyl-CoA carboxylase alpha subunit